MSGQLLVSAPQSCRRRAVRAGDARAGLGHTGGGDWWPGDAGREPLLSARPLLCLLVWWLRRGEAQSAASTR